MEIGTALHITILELIAYANKSTSGDFASYGYVDILRTSITANTYPQKRSMADGRQENAIEASYDI
jgi:hypothetical protein